METQLGHYMGNSTFKYIPGCAKYNSNNECMECGKNTPFLDLYAARGQFCRATCPTNHSIILDNLDGRVNICIRKKYMSLYTGYNAIAPTAAMTNSIAVNLNAPNCRIVVRVAYTKHDILLAYRKTV